MYRPTHKSNVYTVRYRPIRGAWLFVTLYRK